MLKNIDKKRKIQNQQRKVPISTYDITHRLM